jgi:hypothetical protein
MFHRIILWVENNRIDQRAAGTYYVNHAGQHSLLAKHKQRWKPWLDEWPQAAALM